MRGRIALTTLRDVIIPAQEGSPSGFLVCTLRLPQIRTGGRHAKSERARGAKISSGDATVVDAGDAAGGFGVDKSIKRLLRQSQISRNQERDENALFVIRAAA
jgi:hypothetical protein